MNLNKGIKNIVYSVGGQVITLAIGIMIPRLVIVSYGSEINGLMSSISTIITYLSLLEAGIGAATVQALYKPISNKNKSQINAILSATNIYYKRAGAAYFALIFLISFIYPLVVNSTLSYGFMLVMVLINGIPGALNFYFQRKYRTFLETIGDNYILINLSTITSIVTSVLKIVMLQFGISILIVQLVYCFSSLIQMMYVYYYTKKHYGWINLKVKPNKEALSQKSAALIHQICGLVTGSTDVVVLSMFCDLESVSIYTVYNMVFNIVCTSVQSVNSGLQYVLGQSFYKGMGYYKKIINVYETFYTTLASSLMFVCYVCIVPFLKLYTAGADINYIGNSLPVLFLIVKVMDALRNASLNTISVSGNFSTTQKYAVVESFINIIVSVLAVFKFGLSGALCGTIVAFSYRTIIAIWFANVKILKGSCRHSIKTMLVNGTLIIALCLAYNLTSITASSYIQFFEKAVIATGISVVLFFGVNMIADQESFRIIFQLIKNKMNSRIGK